MSKGRNFNYSERAEQARTAHAAIDESFARLKNRTDCEDPATIAWTEAIARFHAATSAAYPKRFWQDFERLKRISRYYVASDRRPRPSRPLKRGDIDAVETAIHFLEADPMFFRSGYVKADLLRFVKRMPLNESQRERLRAVALAIVDRRATQEFRRYCRLATVVANADMAAALEARAACGDAAIARRARWMLPYVAHALPRARKNAKRT